ncbi:hypothetical protein INR49_000461 [Caranx melampygus]|nr:hypothetical protein INR49_000461 [Caranx melampygus]
MPPEMVLTVEADRPVASNGSSLPEGSSCWESGERGAVRIHAACKQERAQLLNACSPSACSLPPHRTELRPPA